MAKLASSAGERRKRGLTVLDGAHLVGAFVDARHKVESVMVSRSALEREEVARIVSRVPASAVTVLADKLFGALSTVDSATGILAAVPAPVGTAIPPDADLVLLLEDVQDPGNVGTLMRSATAAGARHMGLSPGCAFAWSLKTVRAGMGAHFALNIVEGFDIAGFLDTYRGTSVALAGGTARSLYELDLRAPVAFVVGNEGAGLSAAIRARAKVAARIPMPGTAESLNAAVAGSLAIFEALRQRDRSVGKE
ncbi:MAG: TrmH family RNA methyltransferase [Gemmatimonadales bacterium]